MFRPIWQEEIEAEVARNGPRVTRRADAREAVSEVTRVLSSMNRAFPDARRPRAEWEPHVVTMTNHVKDRHVLAVAVGARASDVITCNLSDFPVVSRPHGIAVTAPSEFLLQALETRPRSVLAAVGAMAERHERPAHTVEELARYIAGGVHTGPFGRALIELLGPAPTRSGPLG